ncbi:MAG: hypothetical protein JWP12_1011 [Bacteroidetes bacterium]|nr:hypothetical protein [Bacteroidota bacterium]
MKKLVICTLFIFSVVLAKAQQIGMYSHYFYKPMVYNPAFTGTDDAVNAMLISRSQWTGFKGAPQLNLFTLDGNINKKVGLGLSLISDRKGLSNRMGGDLNYSYRLNINDDMHLLLGVSVGVIDQTMNYSQALVENTTDPTLFTETQRKTVLDASAGLAFIWKGLEFGAAVPQLPGNKIKYVDNTDVRAYYTQARHYMGTLKYKFYISKDKGISLAPMALVRFVPGAPMQYDGNLNFDWKDKFWIGATYKSDYAVGANAGICLYKQLYVGYAYDFVIGDIGKYAGMTSEIMVNYKFGKNKKKEAPEETAAKETPKENPVYEKRLDSLADELEQSQAKIAGNEQKIKMLNDKLNQQAQQQQNNSAVNNNTAANNTNTSGTNSVNQNTSPDQNQNQNATAVSSNSNKVMDNGVWIVTNSVKDFKDENNQQPAKGYYVIAGTFVYQDFAQAEAKRLNNSGFRGSSRVYSETKKYNYVFISRQVSKEEAIKKANDAKAAGIKDAWILLLAD